MPSRVGHVTQINDDGTVRVRNDLTNEEWFGRLIVMSGGMICFDIVDERKRTVSSGRVREADAAGEAAPKQDAPKRNRRRGQRVQVGSGAATSADS